MNIYLFSYKHPLESNPKYVRISANNSNEAIIKAPTHIDGGYLFYKFLGIDPECHI
jgi:hypothetical protein